MLRAVVRIIRKVHSFTVLSFQLCSIPVSTAC